MQNIDIFKLICDAIINGNAEVAKEKTKEAVQKDYDRQAILNYSLIPAMNAVGNKFDTNEIFVSDVLMSSRAMRACLQILKSTSSRVESSNRGRIVIGTVQGDIHDIGKNIVAMMFEGSGFEVIDLGVDVMPSRFVEAVLQYKPDILGLSALLTTVTPMITKTIDALKKAGLRENIKILLGGSAITSHFAKEVGADAYADKTSKLVDIVSDMLPKKSDGVKNLNNIFERIDIRIIEEFLDSLSNVIELSVVLMDLEGRILANTGDFAACSKVCSDYTKYNGAVRYHYNRDVDETVLDNDMGIIYKCPAGLYEIVVPIVYQNNIVATLMAGHVMLKDNSEIITSELAYAIEKGNIIIMTRNRLEKIADFIQKSSRLLVSIALDSITEINTPDSRDRLLGAIKTQIELEQALNNAQLSALENQLNPHFLFNTLNTIVRVAMHEGAKKTEEIAYALADLLRFNLRHTSDIVMLREELEQINRYLYIQKERFKDRFIVCQDIEEDVLKAWVPIMILQPIIENSFVHGFERVSKQCRLDIKAYRRFDKLIIEVIDNGAGMSPEQVKNILQLNFPDSKKSRTAKLGLFSVHKRLQMMFGSDYGLDIQSDIDKGTSVKFFIPFISDLYFYREEERINYGSEYNSGRG